MNSILNNKGFTLLEVLVAIVVVAIGLLAVAGMQTTALTANASGKDATMAIQLAEEMVDRIRINGGTTPGIYTNIDTNNNCVGLADPALGDCIQWRDRLQSSTSGLTNARGQVIVTANSPINNTALITVTVTWGIIRTRSVTFTTIKETLAT